MNKDKRIKELEDALRDMMISLDLETGELSFFWSDWNEWKALLETEGRKWYEERKERCLIKKKHFLNG